jgi:hypothetical protein
MVAFKMNDRFCHAGTASGARSFPGWYAMDSVKWLQRIVVLSREDQPPIFSERYG